MTLTLAVATQSTATRPAAVWPSVCTAALPSPPGAVPLAAPPAGAAVAAGPGAPPEAPTADPGRRQPPLPLVHCANLALARALLDAHLGRCRRRGLGAVLLWLQVTVADPVQRAALLPTLGQRLRHRVRGSDVVVQVGEDAFALLLLDASVPAVALVRNRLRLALYQPCDEASTAPDTLGLHFGHALMGPHGHSARALLGAAGAGPLEA